MEGEGDEQFLHEPDEMEDTPENSGLFCFFNMDRPCNADCMAYTDENAETPYLSNQQKACTLLVAVERLGRYSGGIMKIIKDSAKEESNAKADQARAGAIQEKPHEG